MAIALDPYKAELRVTQKRTFGQGFEGSEKKPIGVEELVESLERDLSEYRRCVESLGTSLDSARHRQELPRLRETIENKIKSVQQDLDVKRKSGVSSIIVRRISDRLQNQLDTFNSLTAKEKDQIMASTNHFDDDDLAQAYDMGGKALRQDYTHDHGLAVREKEAVEIQALERDVQDLHEINKDMNVIVHTQADGIQQIEANTEKAAVRVDKATDTTEKIRVLHWKNRRMRWIIATVVIVVTTVIVVLAIMIVAIAVCAPPGGSC